MLNESGESEDALCAESADRLEAYRGIIVEALGRQRLSTAEVARSLGVDRSYFGKLRRGERPLTERIKDELIDLLRLDRRRLALAIEVMDQPKLYFDPAFRNLCYYAHTMLTDTMALSSAGGDIDCGIIIAAMTRERCELLARHAVKQLADQFAAIQLFPRLGEAA